MKVADVLEPIDGVEVEKVGEESEVVIPVVLS